MSLTLAPTSQVVPPNPVEGAIQIAAALKAAGFPPDQVAPALVSPDVYPMLTALQLGVVLLDPAVFPGLSRAELTAALTAAQKFTAQQIADAVEELYGRARALGPVGGGSAYHPPPQPFDDLAFSSTVGQPLTGINLRAGEIIDSLQGVYGTEVGPQHGGGGGRPLTVRFAPGDRLATIKGLYGKWANKVFVVQLTFVTRNGREFGPYGYPPPAAFITFSLAAGPDEQIVAFFGQVVLAEDAAQPSLMVNQLGAYAKRL